jgi:hypothetical protein
LKKVIVQLQGGLGNQLFQISFAYNLAHIIKANLAIDKSAFLLDRDFGRKFELNKLNFNQCSLIDQFFLYLNRFIYKIFKIKIIKFFNIVFINDSENKRYENKFYNYDYSNIKKIYVVGFFQSIKYSKSKYILKKFYNNMKINHKVISLGRKISKKDIFIGMRFYEENKYFQNSFGGVENYKFYLNKLRYIRNIDCIYLMSTKNLLNELFYKQLIHKKKILNNIFTNEEQLYLMSKFHKMIISNSTFYFWGLFFSNNFNFKKNMKYLISKKFVNKDII